MKLPKYKRFEYKCDKCGSIKKHIDMYNESICNVCFDKEDIQPIGEEDKNE